MAFRCDAATLQRLEWPRLARCLAAQAATERAAQAMLGTDEDGRGLFAATRAGALELLAETGEMRTLLDSEENPPFGGVADLRPLLEIARRGAALAASQLASVLSTLEASGRIAGFFGSRRERAPHLGDLAGTLPDLSRLVGELRGRRSPLIWAALGLLTILLRTRVLSACSAGKSARHPTGVR